MVEIFRKNKLCTYLENVPLVKWGRMWLPHDGASPDFSRVNEIFERKLWRKMDWKKWTGGLARSITRLGHITFLLLLCETKSRVYHIGKPEGRHQPIEATNETTLVSTMKWHACSGNIKWHKDWQHALSVMAGIPNLYYNNLEISMLL